jgi:hypothetical protein
MNRRKFCVSTAAAALSTASAGLTCLTAAAQTASPAPAASSLSVPLYKFIYDRRHPAGRAFGAAAEHVRSTAGIVAIGGDITELWSRDLRLRWSAGGGAIGGLTTARTLFCLEQLAKDHWMRVVIRAEHTISEGHEIAHRLTAPEMLIARMRAALAAEDWPTKLPAVLTACRGVNGAARMTRVVRSACGKRAGVADEMLVSFVIA